MLHEGYDKTKDNDDIFHKPDEVILFFMKEREKLVRFLVRDIDY